MGEDGFRNPDPPGFRPPDIVSVRVDEGGAEIPGTRSAPFPAPVFRPLLGVPFERGVEDALDQLKRAEPRLMDLPDPLLVARGIYLLQTLPLEEFQLWDAGRRAREARQRNLASANKARVERRRAILRRSEYLRQTGVAGRMERARMIAGGNGSPRAIYDILRRYEPRT